MSPIGPAKTVAARRSSISPVMLALRLRKRSMTSSFGCFGNAESKAALHRANHRATQSRLTATRLRTVAQEQAGPAAGPKARYPGSKPDRFKVRRKVVTLSSGPMFLGSMTPSIDLAFLAPLGLHRGQMTSKLSLVIRVRGIPTNRERWLRSRSVPPASLPGIDGDEVAAGGVGIHFAYVTSGSFLPHDNSRWS